MERTIVRTRLKETERCSMSRYLRHAAILVICLVFGTYLWMLQGAKPELVINVQSDAPIYEMTKIIQQQREELEYLHKHPKVIFRCLEDEPKIKYPRHADDALTDIVMATNDECGNMTQLDAVMIVHTAANHFDRRTMFREAYSDYNKTKPYKLKVVFLIGSVLEANTQIELEKENREFGDTVVGGFLDTYQNLTLKAVMGYRWVAETCQAAKLLIKMDDDVFFDVAKFFNRYWMKTSPSKKKNAIHCLVWQNARVGRKGKWKVERGLFAEASYPFPYCAGFFALITPDLIRPMYEHGKSIDFFWIDDVFLYGMVPAAIKGVQHFQIGKSYRAITENYKTFKSCRENKGIYKCPLWAVVTDGGKEFQTEFMYLQHPELMQNVSDKANQTAGQVAGKSDKAGNTDQKGEQDTSLYEGDIKEAMDEEVAKVLKESNEAAIPDNPVPKAQNELKKEAKAPNEPNVIVKAQIEPKAVPKAQNQPGAGPKAQNEPKAEPKAQNEPKAEPIAQNQPKVEEKKKQ